MNQPPSLKAKFVTFAPGDILFTGSPSGSAGMEIVGFGQATAFTLRSRDTWLPNGRQSGSLRGLRAWRAEGAPVANFAQT